eukprot:GDKJ01001361.1.p1 GENE.GDKJ01001361.1~~GDKJ01001361.1.p1  ORF type:complete len:779 (-),score=182.60 GDKJ01001361.1:98-2236(-)
MKQFHSEAVTAMELSHTENLLLTGDIRGNLKFFKDLSYSKEIKLHKSNGAILDISFAPHDHRFAVTLADSHTKILDSNTGREESELGLRSFDATCCSWHPSIRLVATGAKSERVRLWDPRAGKEVANLFAHKQAVSRVRFSSNGQTLISAGRDQVVRVLDLRTLRFISTLRGHSDPVTDVAPHPVFSSILASCDQAGGILFWDIHPRIHSVLIPSSFDHLSHVHPAFAAGNSNATGITANAAMNSSVGPGAGSTSVVIADGIVTDLQLLTALTMKLPTALATSIAAQISSIAPVVAPSLQDAYPQNRFQNTHSSHDDQFSYQAQKSSASSFTATEGVVKPTLPLTAIHNAHSGAVKCIRWNPSGDLVASGGDDCTIRLWARPSPCDDENFSKGASVLLSEIWNVNKTATEHVAAFSARLDANEHALEMATTQFTPSSTSNLTSNSSANKLMHEPGAAFSAASTSHASMASANQRVLDPSSEWTKIKDLLPLPPSGVPLPIAHSSLQVVVRRPIQPTTFAGSHQVRRSKWPQRHDANPISGVEQQDGSVAVSSFEVNFAKNKSLYEELLGGSHKDETMENNSIHASLSNKEISNWGDSRKFDPTLNILARTTVGLSSGVLAKDENWNLMSIVAKEKFLLQQQLEKQKQQQQLQEQQQLQQQKERDEEDFRQNAVQGAGVMQEDGGKRNFVSLSQDETLDFDQDMPVKRFKEES